MRTLGLAGLSLFTFLTGIPSRPMKKRGDGSSDNKIGVLVSWAPGRRLACGVWVPPRLWCCPLEPSPPPEMCSRKWCGVGVGGELRGSGCGERSVQVNLWGPYRPLPTVPLWSTPSACTCATSGCGPRAGTRSRGGISSEKRCSSLNLSSQSQWEPHDPAPAQLLYVGGSEIPALSALPHLSQVMGNRRSDEPTKTKKGLSSFLDAARWNRGEPQGEVPSLAHPDFPAGSPPTTPPPPPPHGPIGPISRFSPRFSTPQNGG